MLCQLQAIVCTGPARGLHLAKDAVVTGTEGAFPCCCQLCDRCEYLIGPLEKRFGRHLISVHVVTPRLIDRELYAVDAVETAERVKGSQCVAHELRVLCGSYQDTDAIFVIDDV